jgi:hypothetical protein
LANDGVDVSAESVPIDTPPVEAEENLLRQLSPDTNPLWFDPDRCPSVHHAAFIPSKRDHDGLSLIRARFRSRLWAAYRLNKPETRYRLAPRTVNLLIELAVEAGFPTLTLKPTEDDLDARHGEPWAHCVAMQINRRDYDDRTNKRMRACIKSWARLVATSLTADIIEGPFDPPTDSTPYRP